MRTEPTRWTASMGTLRGPPGRARAGATADARAASFIDDGDIDQAVVKRSLNREERKAPGGKADVMLFMMNMFLYAKTNVFCPTSPVCSSFLDLSDHHVRKLHPLLAGESGAGAAEVNPRFGLAWE
jgi:hypothetical protein